MQSNSDDSGPATDAQRAKELFERELFGIGEPPLVILALTTFAGFHKFRQEKDGEALLDRIVIIKVPHALSSNPAQADDASSAQAGTNSVGREVMRNAGALDTSALTRERRIRNDKTMAAKATSQARPKKQGSKPIAKLSSKKLSRPGRRAKSSVTKRTVQIQRQRKTSIIVDVARIVRNIAILLSAMALLHNGMPGYRHSVPSGIEPAPQAYVLAEIRE